MDRYAGLQQAAAYEAFVVGARHDGPISLCLYPGDITARSDSAETVFSVRLPRRH